TARRAGPAPRRPAPLRERLARGRSRRGLFPSNLRASFITFSAEIQRRVNLRILPERSEGPLEKNRAGKGGEMRISIFRRGRVAWAPAVLSLSLVAAWPASPTLASSHREAPGIAKYPLWDNTDVYAFRDPIVTDRLTILSNWIPLEDPSGFPNFFHFDENTWYQIHIDNDGDGVEHITYRFIFTENVRTPNSFLNFLGPVAMLNDPNTNIYSTYTTDKIIGPAGNTIPAANITRIGSGLLELPNNAGPKPFSNGYNVQTLGAGVYTVDA